MSDRSAALYWLKYAPASSTPAARQRMAARLMLASVYLQAYLLCVVSCSRCGDTGCDWCRGLARA